LRNAQRGVVRDDRAILPMSPSVEDLYHAIRTAMEAGRAQEAIGLAGQALAAGGNDGFFRYILGNCQFKAGDYAQAAANLAASVRLDPTRAEAFNDLAATLFVLGRDAEALTCLRRALVLRPDLPEALETDAIWLLRYGRFREGWQKYEARFDTNDNRHLRPSFTQPRWRGESLGGRTILLHAEQGLGDALQFVRYAPLVAARGGRVVLGVYASVVPLLANMAGVAEVVDLGGKLPHFDLHCSLMSLPLVFGTDLDSIPAAIPYLSVADERIGRWRTRLGPRRGLRVGVAWSGNRQHRDDARRSIPFGTFAALLGERKGVEYHVVQTELREGDREALARLPHVRNHADALADFADTGALVSLLDVVISVDTAVVHLAGALGRPVWLLLAHLADWRWLLERDDSPWYGSLWLLRQPERGDWGSVLVIAGERLREMVS
jgi:hypothetical protein